MDKSSRRTFHGKVTASTSGGFVGRANEYEVRDRGGELVRFGAARKTAREKAGKIPVMVKHFARDGDVLDAVGIVRKLTERPDGLWIEADFLGDEASQKLRQKVAGMLEEKLPVGLSIGYRPIAWHREKVDGKDTLVLTEIALYEVTITLKPMNEGSYVSSVKTEPADPEVDQEIQRMRRAVGRGARKGRTAPMKTKAKTAPRSKQAPSAFVADARLRVAQVEAQVAGVTVDHRQEERTHCRVFQGFLEGKGLSGEERELLKPRSRQEWGGTDGPGYIRVPNSYAADVFGPGWAELYHSKGLLAVASEESNPSRADELIPLQRNTQVYRSPILSPLHELCQIVTSDAYVLAMPEILSTAAQERPQMVEWEDPENDGTTKPEREPIFPVATVRSHVLHGCASVSSRSYRRFPSMREMFRIIVRESVEAELANVIINGDGRTQPLGIIHAAGIHLVNRTTAGAVTHPDIVHLKHSLKPASQRNAIWILNDRIIEQAELNADAVGDYIAEAEFDVQRTHLLGMRYRSEDESPAMGSTGDIIAADMRRYVLGMESELVLEASSHFDFQANRITLRWSTAVGGRPQFPRGFAVLDSAGS